MLRYRVQYKSIKYLRQWNNECKISHYFSEKVSFYIIINLKTHKQLYNRYIHCKDIIFGAKLTLFRIFLCNFTAVLKALGYAGSGLSHPCACQ